jgi:dipeptide/tripeptide permease
MAGVGMAVGAGLVIAGVGVGAGLVTAGVGAGLAGVGLAAGLGFFLPCAAALRSRRDGAKAASAKADTATKTIVSFRRCIAVDSFLRLKANSPTTIHQTARKVTIFVNSRAVFGGKNRVAP